MQAMGALSGRRLADYELGAPLGEDGFGPIYAARHLNLGRVFALRILSDQFTFAQGFEERFWRVTRVLAALEHANLLTLDDFGVDGPYAYLVTPYVEGLTLDTWLGQRPGQPLNPAQVIRLFGQMLGGLVHAHQAGVTHLGLAPRHILLQPNGHLLLANFGLPYLAEQLWIAWNGSRTFGDPLYLAPEQMPGRTPAGVAADVYALGVILYRLLTGALPFEGTRQAMLEAKLTGPPPLRVKNPQLPAPLEALAQRALAPSPADRWASAAALGMAFYQALGMANPLPSSSLAAGRPGASPLPAGYGAGPLLLGPGVDPTSGSIGASTSSPLFSSGPLSSGPLDPGRARHAAVSGPLDQPPAGPPALKGQPSAVLTWSSAGKGRVSVPPPPPGWVHERAAPPRRPPRGRSRARRLLSAAIRVLALLVTLAVLSFALFYGYQRWAQIQHQMATPTPTAAPSATPTPKHRVSAAAERVIV